MLYGVSGLAFAIGVYPTLMMLSIGGLSRGLVEKRNAELVRTQRTACDGP